MGSGAKGIRVQLEIAGPVDTRHGAKGSERGIDGGDYISHTSRARDIDGMFHIVDGEIEVRTEDPVTGCTGEIERGSGIVHRVRGRIYRDVGREAVSSGV